MTMADLQRYTVAGGEVRCYDHGEYVRYSDVCLALSCRDEDRATIAELRTALENIKTHQTHVGGSIAELSTVWKIADTALHCAK